MLKSGKCAPVRPLPMSFHRLVLNWLRTGTTLPFQFRLRSSQLSAQRTRAQRIVAVQIIAFFFENVFIDFKQNPVLYVDKIAEM
jgi:hypothetical protein